MAKVVTPPVVGVNAPTRDFPVPFGLFSAAEMPEGLDSHWVNGIQWEHSAAASGLAGLSVTCADGPVDLSSVAPLVNLHADAVGSPFTLYATHTCTPVGLTVEEAEAMVRDALLVHEQEAVEEVISSGSLATVPNFQGGPGDLFNNVGYAAAAVLNGGTAVSPSVAVGLLADFAATNYGLANSVIHAPRSVSSVLAREGVVDRNGSRLEIITGEVVSAGAGYANESPAGAVAADGEAWLYLTPPVIIVMSDVETTKLSNFDRGRNNVQVRASRTFVVGWDNLPIAAIPMTLPT